MKVNCAYFQFFLSKTAVILPLAFIINLSSLAQVVQTESFDQYLPPPAPCNVPSQNLPFGWTQGIIVGASPYNYFDRLACASNPVASPRTGAGMCRYRSYLSPAGEKAYMASKPYDLSSRGAVTPSNFRFWMFRDNLTFQGMADSISVWINTQPSMTGAVCLADSANGLFTINRSCALSPAPVVNPGWNLYGYTIPAGAAWSVSKVYVIIKGCSRFGNDILLDDFSITTYPSAQTFTSCSFHAQNVTNIGAGTSAPSSNNWIIQIRAVTNGAGAGGLGMVVDSIKFNTNGSTFPCTDIQANGAKLWWMGGTKSLDLTIAQQIGGNMAVCGTNFVFVSPANSFRLDNDTNYFWVTYDIEYLPPAIGGDCVDAEFIEMRAGGATHTPSVFTMAGCRIINEPYCIPVYTIGPSRLNGSYTNNDYVRQVVCRGDTAYGPGIANAYNSNGPFAGGCAGPGTNCPFSANPPAYERFLPTPGKTTVFIADGITSYTLQAQAGTWGSGNVLGAWIDFNHDFDFLDASEHIGTSGLLAGSTNYPLVGTYPTYGGWWQTSFIVPATATTGNTTFRIRETWSGMSMTACSNEVYGETEDYTVTILPDCNLSASLNGWSVWLGGFSDDWNILTNWCGGIPTTTKDAIIVDSATAINAYGVAPGNINPTYYPVIKNGVIANTRKLRIHGADSLTINANLANGSLNIYDSLNIVNSTAKLKVKSSHIDTAQLSNGNLLQLNALIFNGTYARQRLWMTYAPSELTAQGMQVNDVIDTMIFHIAQRNSTVPYSNFTIKFFYATNNVCFLAPASSNPIPPITGGAGAVLGGYPGGVTTVFSGTVDLTGLPASGGVVKIPLTTPHTWVYTAANFFVEICYDNPGSFLSDHNHITQTLGCQSFYKIQIQTGGGAPDGCNLLNSTTGVNRYRTDNRPNITYKFHRNYAQYPINIRSTSAAMPGHWGNNGVFEAGRSIVTFMGTNGTQNIGGAITTTFNKLVINNASHVRQNTAAVVDSNLHLQLGRFKLNGHTLTLNNGLTAPSLTPGLSRTNNGYFQSEDFPPNYGLINWKIGANIGVYLFPFINNIGAGEYVPFRYTATSGTSDFTIGTYNTPPNNAPWPTGVTGINAYLPPNLPNSANMVDRYWIISNTGTAPVGDFEFNFGTSEQNGGSPAFYSQGWNSSVYWQPPTAGQSSVVNQNITPGVSAFNSAWALYFNNSPLLTYAVITPSGPATFCVGSNVVLNVNSAPVSSYQWFRNGIAIPGATTASYIAGIAGNYTVQITYVGGTIISAPVTVTVNALPTATISPAGPTTFCQGGSVVLNANTGANLAYQWKKNGNVISGAASSSYTATSSGTYIVIVTNTITGCTKTSHSGIVVTVNPKPPATITPSGTIIFCAGQSALLTANSGTGFTYKWKKNGSYISGATSITYTVTTAGNYRVEVTNSNGCSQTSVADTVIVPCKAGENEDEVESKFDMIISPNPSPGVFTIHFSEKPSVAITIEIMDAIGQVIDRVAINEEEFVIDKSNLAKGIYYLVATSKEIMMVKKIVIQ